MTPIESIELACPAKVNLALAVGPPLPNGFHPLASWMAAVNFSDRMTLRKTTGASRFDLAFAEDAPVPAKVDWPLEKDLVFRAHRLLEEKVGRALPVELTLRKYIPAGAGLGGGSSDAAAALVGVNRLHNAGLETTELANLARKLGSDVAFLVHALLGQPSALVTGLGEGFEPLPIAELIHLVLILPPFGCPTGAVYQAFDRRLAAGKSAENPDADRIRRLASRFPVPQDAPFNDLAEPACDVRPELAVAREKLRAFLQIPVHITGSGSTLFVISPSALTAKATARRINAETGLAAVATRTL